MRKLISLPGTQDLIKNINDNLVNNLKDIHRCIPRETQKGKFDHFLSKKEMEKIKTGTKAIFRVALPDGSEEKVNTTFVITTLKDNPMVSKKRVNTSPQKKSNKKAKKVGAENSEDSTKTSTADSTSSTIADKIYMQKYQETKNESDSITDSQVQPNHDVEYYTKYIQEYMKNRLGGCAAWMNVTGHLHEQILKHPLFQTYKESCTGNVLVFLNLYNIGMLLHTEFKFVSAFKKDSSTNENSIVKVPLIDEPEKIIPFQEIVNSFKKSYKSESVFDDLGHTQLYNNCLNEKWNHLVLAILVFISDLNRTKLHSSLLHSVLKKLYATLSRCDFTIPIGHLSYTNNKIVLCVKNWSSFFMNMMKFSSYEEKSGESTEEENLENLEKSSFTYDQFDGHCHDYFSHDVSPDCISLFKCKFVNKKPRASKSDNYSLSGLKKHSLEVFNTYLASVQDYNQFIDSNKRPCYNPSETSSKASTNKTGDESESESQPNTPKRRKSSTTATKSKDKSSRATATKSKDKSPRVLALNKLFFKSFDGENRSGLQESFESFVNFISMTYMTYSVLSIMNDIEFGPILNTEFYFKAKCNNEIESPILILLCILGDMEPLNETNSKSNALPSLVYHNFFQKMFLICKELNLFKTPMEVCELFAEDLELMNDGKPPKNVDISTIKNHLSSIINSFFNVMKYKKLLITQLLEKFEVEKYQHPWSYNNFDFVIPSQKKSVRSSNDNSSNSSVNFLVQNDSNVIGVIDIHSLTSVDVNSLQRQVKIMVDSMKNLERRTQYIDVKNKVSSTIQKKRLSEGSQNIITIDDNQIDESNYSSTSQDDFLLLGSKNNKKPKAITSQSTNDEDQNSNDRSEPDEDDIDVDNNKDNNSKNNGEKKSSKNNSGSKQNKKTQVTKMSHENADKKRFKFLNSKYLANESRILNEDIFHTCDEEDCAKPSHVIIIEQPEQNKSKKKRVNGLIGHLCYTHFMHHYREEYDNGTLSLEEGSPQELADSEIFNWMDKVSDLKFDSFSLGGVKQLPGKNDDPKDIINNHMKRRFLPKKSHLMGTKTQEMSKIPWENFFVTTPHHQSTRYKSSSYEDIINELSDEWFSIIIIDEEKAASSSTSKDDSSSKTTTTSSKNPIKRKKGNNKKNKRVSFYVEDSCAEEKDSESTDEQKKAMDKKRLFNCINGYSKYWTNSLSFELCPTNKPVNVLGLDMSSRKCNHCSRIIEADDFLISEVEKIIKVATHETHKQLQSENSEFLHKMASLCAVYDMQMHYNRDLYKNDKLPPISYLSDECCQYVMDELVQISQSRFVRVMFSQAIELASVLVQCSPTDMKKTVLENHINTCKRDDSIGRYIHLPTKHFCPLKRFKDIDRSDIFANIKSKSSSVIEVNMDNILLLIESKRNKKFQTEIFRSFGDCNCDDLILDDNEVNEIIDDRKAPCSRVIPEMFYSNSPLHCLVKIWKNETLNLTHFIWSKFFENLLLKRNCEEYYSYSYYASLRARSTDPPRFFPDFQLIKPSSHNYHYLNVCDFYFSRVKCFIPRNALKLLANAFKRTKKFDNIEEHIFCNVVKDIIQVSLWYENASNWYDDEENPQITSRLEMFPDHLLDKYNKNFRDNWDSRVLLNFLQFHGTLKVDGLVDGSKNQFSEEEYDDALFTHFLVRYLFPTGSFMNFRGFIYEVETPMDITMKSKYNGLKRFLFHMNKELGTQCDEGYSYIPWLGRWRTIKPPDTRNTKRFEGLGLLPWDKHFLKDAPPLDVSFTYTEKSENVYYHKEMIVEPDSTWEEFCKKREVENVDNKNKDKETENDENNDCYAVNNDDEGSQPKEQDEEEEQEFEHNGEEKISGNVFDDDDDDDDEKNKNNDDEVSKQKQQDEEEEEEQEVELNGEEKTSDNVSSSTESD